MTGDTPKPTELVLEDQFDRKADLSELRGQVVVIVYGDKESDASLAVREHGGGQSTKSLASLLEQFATLEA